MRLGAAAEPTSKYRIVRSALCRYGAAPRSSPSEACNASGVTRRDKADFALCLVAPCLFRTITLHPSLRIPDETRHDHRILQGNSGNYTGEGHCRLDAGVSYYLRQPSSAVLAGVLYVSRRKLNRGLDGGKLTYGDCLCLDSSPAGHRSYFRIYRSG